MGISIFIADDHGIMREGIRSLLDKEQDMEVIGEADNGRMTVQHVRKLKPDIVLMDITMPGLGGIGATLQIAAESPHTRVIALSMHSDRMFVADMLAAGAKGYILKQNSSRELIKAIRAVMEDQIYLSQKIVDVVVTNYLNGLSVKNSSLLTPREKEIVQLFAEGNTTKNIASELNLSVKTIETHRSRIMDKLGINSIAELTKFAIKAGLTSLES